MEQPTPPPLVVVVMGVSGSGKTTVARLVAAATGWPFLEGDDLHPAANVAKMSSGQPLTDVDRAPWLASLAEAIDRLRAAGQGGIVTCSALRRAYRNQVIGHRSGMALVYLRGSHDLLEQRMRSRAHHFMPVTLLDSQLATLEEPGAEEQPLTISVSGTPEETAHAVVAALTAQQDQARQHQEDGP